MNFNRHLLLAFLIFLSLLFIPGRLASQEVDLLISPGKLSRVHSEYSGLKNCEKCHTDGTRSVATKCLDCHKDLEERIDQNRGYHRDKKGSCASCHPEHHGSDFPLVEWQPENFVHAQTGYPLEGLHSRIPECKKCHNPTTALPEKKETSYLVVNTKCVTCHKDVHSNQLGLDCQRCHGLETPFKEVQFNHSNIAYPLKGAHNQVSCEKCHVEKQWKGLKYDQCLDCHRDVHASSFGNECSKCHTVSSWKTENFDHQKTNFPLKGKHAPLKCDVCHKKNLKQPLAYGQCRDCHSSDPHKGQFQQDCVSCHDEMSFRKTLIDHQKTSYPLKGKHTQVECKKCHFPQAPDQPVIYKPLKTDCVDCHVDIHVSQLSTDCSKCHSVRGFDSGTLSFDHDRDSSYVLEGAHKTTACDQCHQKTEISQSSSERIETIRFRPLSTACVSCHRDIHLGQLGQACNTCHTLVQFKPAPLFSHDKSRFPIDILHEAVVCVKCHTPEDQPVSESAVPVLRYKPLGTRCQDCHVFFNHADKAFPLTGKHRVADCASCHTPSRPFLRRMRGNSGGHFECKDCHSYRHPGNQQDCSRCHSTIDWEIGI